MLILLPFSVLTEKKLQKWQSEFLPTAFLNKHSGTDFI